MFSVYNLFIFYCKNNEKKKKRAKIDKYVHYWCVSVIIQDTERRAEIKPSSVKKRNLLTFELSSGKSESLTELSSRQVCSSNTVCVLAAAKRLLLILGKCEAAMRAAAFSGLSLHL